MENVTHTFEPIFDSHSKILILGSFPSVKSREGQFYYHHPRNRFWPLIAFLLSCTAPNTIEDKKHMLLSGRIAIWDVIKSCDIQGSSDSSIKNVIPADINRILKKADIRTIYGNGATACQLYNKYCCPSTKRDIVKLPSTSPANAAFSLEKLAEEWKVILTDLY